MKQLNIRAQVTEIKNRISSYILPGHSPGLEQQQIYGIMLAAVGASNSTNFAYVIESIISEYVDQSQHLSSTRILDRSPQTRNL